LSSPDKSSWVPTAAGSIEFTVECISGIKADWVSFFATEAELLPISTEFDLTGAGDVDSKVGRVFVKTTDGAPVPFWRRDLIINLLKSRLLTEPARWIDELSELGGVIQTASSCEGVPPTAGVAQLAQSGPVIVMSKHGIIRFGGGEQFIDSMAEHYESFGYSPIVVGTRPERVGESGQQDGRQFAFVDENPDELRRYFVEQRPTFVHVLSGLGYQVTEALEFLSIPFIYGVHFWRDCLGRVAGDNRFFDGVDSRPIIRPEFRAIIERAAYVYSNSEYTRGILEQAFSIRTPVIYSLPRHAKPIGDFDEARASLLGDVTDYVLLVNTKPDKGFDFMIEVAGRLPAVRFVAIASQSDSAEAVESVRASLCQNLTVLPRTDRMDVLYAAAKIVVVPSYKFVETFSRVCIEAQRYGKPVIGSTVGNVPYLLDKSGVILDENADDWAAEIEKIYGSDQYYGELVARARLNSERYSYETQVAATAGIVKALKPSILIGVGSGIGNMLHVAPMIRRISNHFGRKVDIVVAEDHSNSLFLLHNPLYVNAAYDLRQQVLRKSHDLVFLTHSFGAARVPFNSPQVLNSRDWKNFEPRGPYHETIYNLEAARHMLGVEYEEADATEYYVGSYQYAPPTARRLIGIHGGSKDGFWASKRWPYYSQLAERLVAHGFEVASFGIEAEFIEGTIDLTGGSIEQMVGSMLECAYFISNDSGLMNIANALGIPLTGIFGPTNPETRGPMRASSSWISLDKSCAPCETTTQGRDVFLGGMCRCIQEIDVDTVEQHVLGELRRHQLL